MKSAEIKDISIKDLQERIETEKGAAGEAEGAARGVSRREPFYH